MKVDLGPEVGSLNICRASDSGTSVITEVAKKVSESLRRGVAMSSNVLVWKTYYKGIQYVYFKTKKTSSKSKTYLDSRNKYFIPVLRSISFTMREFLYMMDMLKHEYDLVNKPIKIEHDANVCTTLNLRRGVMSLERKMTGQR